MSAWCLTVHAGYRCRHSGACCRAHWAIPVEGPAFERLRVHFGRLRSAEELFETGGSLPAGAAAILRTNGDGACVFFEERSGGCCAVHRELGPKMLPVACRQFPRIVLRDGRGTFVTLSHYCPTAAELLLQPIDLAVQPAPDNLALAGEAEGLDATGVLPPLIRPNLLMDLEAYATWEERAIGVLARDSVSSDEAIATIAAATEQVAQWRPGDGLLRDVVERAFDGPPSQRASLGCFGEASAGPCYSAADLRSAGRAADVERVRLALASVPSGLSTSLPVENYDAGWIAVSEWWDAYEPAVRRYLAARLFGNWIAYYGNGLGAIVEAMRLSLAVLKMEAVRQQQQALHLSERRRFIEAVRQTDLLMVHFSDVRTLARLIAKRSSPSRSLRPAGVPRSAALV